MADSKDRDFPQVLKESYDANTQRLKVESIVTDGIDALIVNSDGSINTRIFDSAGASVLLGQKTAAQSLPVVLASDTPGFSVIESGTFSNVYGEVLSIPMNMLTTVTTYTATQDVRVRLAEVSGTNIAEWTVNVNSSIVNKKRTFFGNLNETFQFDKGYPLVLGDVVEVQVTHSRPSVGDFNSSLVLLKDP